MAYLNRPSGGSLISSHPFNTIDGNGWFSVFPGGGSIVADSGELETPPNCYRTTWNHSSTGNSAVPTLAFSSIDEVYVGFTWKPSNPFTGWANLHNKIMFIWTTTALIYMSMQGNQGGPYSFWWSLSLPGVSNSHLPGWGDTVGSWNLSPQQNGSISLGIWHRVEVYAKRSTSSSSQNGILRYWLDGNLVSNYTNLNQPSPWNQIQFVQSWDAAEPNFPNAFDEHRYGDALVINPGGTIVIPPQQPTISSFTPTSGTFGTPLTIIGTNYDPNPSGNSVSLNNAPCAVLAATTTQINTAVPNNATTGRVRVTTQNGTATSTTEFTVEVAPTGTGLLQGSRAVSANTVLSNEGVIDWAHWGLTDANSFNSRSGASTEISNVTTSGTGSKSRYADNPTAFTWTGGTPSATATATTTGIFTTTGFTFTAPADTTERILRVYAGGFNATVRVQAVLTDNSAAAYTDSTYTAPAVVGGGNAVWSLRYRAGEPGVSQLAVTVSLLSGGNVQLQAATLQLANAPTEQITLSPSSLTVEASDDPETPAPSGTLTLSINPARAAATIVTLESSNSSVVSIPALVTIPAAASSIPIVIVGLSAGSSTITATLGANTATSTITVIDVPDEPQLPSTSALNLYTSFLDVYRWM
jgi:hypothetical protein